MYSKHSSRDDMVSDTSVLQDLAMPTSTSTAGANGNTGTNVSSGNGVFSALKLQERLLQCGAKLLRQVHLI